MKTLSLPNAKLVGWCIAFQLCMSSVTLGANFSWDNFLLARMKLDKSFDYEAHVDSYLRKFRPEVWKTYHNDEFELEEKRVQTIGIMKRRVQAFSLDEEIVLNTSVTLGKYDFGAAQFPVTRISESYYWYSDAYSTGDFPSRFKIYFNNLDLLKTIPMAKSKASTFVKRRKRNNGAVNRTVQLTVRFKVLKLKNERDEFLAEIQSVAFYDDEGKTRLIHKARKETTKEQSASSVAQAKKRGAAHSH